MTDSQHLTNDPEILALLDFQAVPRRCKKEGGWTAEMQRLFIAKLAVHGSPGKACDELLTLCAGTMMRASGCSTSS